MACAMVERVARGLCLLALIKAAASGEGEASGQAKWTLENEPEAWVDRCWFGHVMEATAAISIMREPTEEMVHQAYERMVDDKPDAHWRVMVDVALGV